VGVVRVDFGGSSTSTDQDDDSEGDFDKQGSSPNNHSSRVSLRTKSSRSKIPQREKNNNTATRKKQANKENTEPKRVKGDCCRLNIFYNGFHI
jgi:hypothetical protein